VRIPLKDTFVRASIRKRLWMGAGAVAIFIGTLLAALIVTPTDPHDQGKVGLDFIAFYTAGRFVSEGKSADLYDIRAVHRFQFELGKENGVDLGSAVGPWWNPPFYAWVFVPIAKFPYREAMKIWMLLNVACAGISAAFLCAIVARAARPCLEPVTTIDDKSKFGNSTGRMPVPLGGWKSWLLAPVLMVLSTPFIHALSHGQNTCTSLLLVTMVVMLWRKDRAIAAGLVTGLLFYKPQLGTVLTAVLVLSLGWRTLIGIGITGILLLIASLLLPGSLHDFLVQMPRNLHFVQCDVPYLWDRHVTYKAFWRLLLQGMDAGEPTWAVTILSSLCQLAVGAGLLWAALRVKKFASTPQRPMSDIVADAKSRRDRLIAAAIAATPLLMPFYFDYDQLLLAIPAVLFAADILRRDRSVPINRGDVWLMRIWPAQYVWLMLNSDVAGAARIHIGSLLSVRNPLYHINLGVLLLTGVAVLLIARTGRRREAVAIASHEFTDVEHRLTAA
jgi:hypothetical protein